MKDMLGRGHAVSVEEAVDLILSALPQAALPSETSVPIDHAYGRVAARDILAPEDLPGFARSTVDGFALAAADTFGATEASPAYIPVSGEVLMGEPPGAALARGQAVRIATGGMLPEGADAVLMLEDAQVADGATVEAQRAVAPGENVIRPGEDVARGATVIGRGRRLRAEDVALLAGLGLTEAAVYGRPRVSVVSTGDEVVAPGGPLRPGLVRDMNSYLLEGLVYECGGLPHRAGVVEDDYSKLRDALERAAGEAPLVLVSGGSSVGARDMTERVLTDLGRILFHSVSVKPGKPTLAGIVGRALVLGLPGHPRAAAVCFDVFVRPVLARLCGCAPADSFAAVPARLARGVASAPGREDHINVVLESRDGGLWATPLLGKSGLLSTLVRSHGAITIPRDTLGLSEGDPVEVRLRRP